MCRATAADRWVTLAVTNAAFRILPDAVRLLWHEILGLALTAPDRGLLRFDIPLATALAELLRKTEPEIATGLARLAAAGMLEPDSGGQALWLPGARAGLARADAARQNGKNGGRRRAGETLEDMRARRQREREAGFQRAQTVMLHSIKGGGMETQGTEARKASDDDDKKIPISLSSPSTPQARADAALAMMAAVMEIAGIDPARTHWHAGEAGLWLNLGATQALVEEVAREVMGRKPGGTPPGSPRYFTGPIEAAVKAGRTATPPADPTAPVTPAIAYARALEAATREGRTPPRLSDFMRGAA
jgi:hypothetical protein